MRNNDILPLGQRKTMLQKFETFLFLLSIAFLLMPFATKYHKEIRIFPVCVGILFWFGIFGTTVMAVSIDKNRRKCVAFNKEYKSSIKTLGLINFFSNKKAKVADIATAIALCGCIVSWILSKNYVLFVFIAVFTFSFGMHCMLNGINYKFINYNARRVES